MSATSEAVEIPTMVRPADPGKAVTRMVELRAVQRGFPFYGTLTLQDGTYSHDTAAEPRRRSCGRSCSRSSTSRSAIAS